MKKANNTQTYTMTYKKKSINTHKYTIYIHYYKLNLVTPYSDFITGNSSVYVRNGNQGEYTKNTHCEKKYICGANK